MWGRETGQGKNGTNLATAHAVGPTASWGEGVCLGESRRARADEPRSTRADQSYGCSCSQPSTSHDLRHEHSYIAHIRTHMQGRQIHAHCKLHRLQQDCRTEYPAAGRDSSVRPPQPLVVTRWYCNASTSTRFWPIISHSCSGMLKSHHQHHRSDDSDKLS
jgi:hypothetical protein